MHVTGGSPSFRAALPEQRNGCTTPATPTTALKVLEHGLTLCQLLVGLPCGPGGFLLVLNQILQALGAIGFLSGI